MAAPAWFTAVVDGLDFEDRWVDVSSCAIHYQLFRQGPRAGAGVPRAPVVLVHGGGAHSRWWDWTAPWLAADGRAVACIDLSGHGDSGVRAEAYSMELHAEEVRAVCREVHREAAAAAAAAARVPRPIVIGHSFGGWVTIVAARLFGAELGGVIVLDSPVRPVGHPSNQFGPPKGMRTRRPGDSFEKMKQRFKLMPPQACENTYLLDYIFQHSVRRHDEDSSGGGGGGGGGGSSRARFDWKDDPQRFTKMYADGSKYSEEAASLRLRGLGCRVAVCYGETSMFFDELVIDHMRSELARQPTGPAPLVPIPSAAHHVMFDQPLAVVSILRAFLNSWDGEATATASAGAAGEPRRGLAAALPSRL